MTQSKNLIVKSNDLVEARYRLNIWETRVFAKMVTMINKDDKDFKRYKIDIKELMKFFGTMSNNDYKRIKEVPESLMKKIVRIPVIDNGKEKLFKTTILSSVLEPNEKVLTDGNSILELRFDPDLLPFLLTLKEKFLQYDIENILKISCPYSVRIYELLKQYEKIGNRTIEIKELKEILGIEDKYKKYSHLKNRIIKQAQKDLLEDTDIHFTFNELKQNRKVYAIKFLIHQNIRNKKSKTEIKKNKSTPSPITPQPLKQEAKPTFTIDPKVAKSKAMNIMIGEGISFDVAQSFVLKYDSDEELVAELQYIKKQLNNKSNILSKTALMVKMLEQQNFKKITIFKEAQEELRKQAEQVQSNERTLLINQHKAKIEELKDEFKVLQDNALNQILEGKDQTEIDNSVSARVIQKPQIRRAIKRAKDANDVAQEQELVRSLFVKDIKDKKLQNFKEYIAATYQYRIVVEADGEFLKFIKS